MSNTAFSKVVLADCKGKVHDVPAHSHGYRTGSKGSRSAYWRTYNPILQLPFPVRPSAVPNLRYHAEQTSPAEKDLFPHNHNLPSVFRFQAKAGNFPFHPSGGNYDARHHKYADTILTACGNTLLRQSYPKPLPIQPYTIQYKHTQASKKSNPAHNRTSHYQTGAKTLLHIARLSPNHSSGFVSYTHQAGLK